MSDETSSNGDMVKATDLDYAIQPTDQTSKDLDSMSGSKYLPRIQLADGNSKLVKEKGGLAGHYYFVRSADSFDDLTKQFDAIVFARRAKAVRMSQAGIFSFFDPKHPEFLKIIDESEIRDSGCFYGPEYLLWVKPLKQWATLLCASKTARRSSTDINTILKKFDESRQAKKAWDHTGEEPVVFNPFATFRASIKRKANYSWQGMDITPCSTPFGVTPPGDEIQEQLTRFLNPPKTDVETVQEDKSTKRAR